MTRRALPVWTASLLLLSSCGGGGDTSSTAAPTAPPVSEAVEAEDEVPAGYTRFMEDAAGADPTAQQTLDWVAATLGVELPGATGAYGDLTEVVFSSTLALEWVTLHWNEFTADQQAALRAAFGAGAAPSSGVLRRPDSALNEFNALLDELVGPVGRLMGFTLDRSKIRPRRVDQANLGTATAATGPEHEWLGLGAGYCDMSFGSKFERAAATDRRAAVAHELAHCAVHQRYDYSPPETPKWWDEGGIAYVGEAVVPDSTLEHAPTWWRIIFSGNARNGGYLGYSFTYDPTGYTGIGLFSYLAEQRGAETVMQGWLERFGDPARADWLLGGAPGSAGRAATLAGYSSAAVRQSWGARWTMAGVNLSNHGVAGRGRTQNPVTVRTNTSLGITLSNPQFELAAAYRLDPAPSVDLLAIQISGAGAVTAQGAGEMATAGAPVTQVFCIGPACECNDRIRELVPIAPVSIARGVSPVVALAADAGTRSVIGVQGYDLPDDGSCNPCPEAVSSGLLNRPGAGDFDPVCGPGDTVPPPEPEPGDGGCLVGTWAVDAEAMVAVFAASANPAASEGPIEHQVSGSWTMTLADGGAMTTVIDNWQLTVDFFGPGGLGSEEPVPIRFTMTFNGTVTGTWSVSGSTFSIAGAQGNIGVTIKGEVMGQTFDVTSPELANLSIGRNGTSNYTCAGDRLTLTAQVANALPLHFVR